MSTTRRLIHISKALKAAESKLKVESVYDDINRNLDLKKRNAVSDVARYYFDGQGKALRPKLALLMAEAANKHVLTHQEPSGALTAKQQRVVALVTEMYHTASLLHDDVIDRADLRRGKDSVNVRFGVKNSITGGDFAIATATKMLAETGNVEVVRTVTRILRRLVQGELQQMQGKSEKKDRFQLYLDKTYNKTASLMALSCKAVVLFALEEMEKSAEKDMKRRSAEEAFSYGKNLGVAFQLVDDWLDFVADADQLGKPGAGADLKLGLATAPVLFAREQYPQLDRMIARGFSRPTDPEEAFLLVKNSSGLDETRFLAGKYADSAQKCISDWRDSKAKNELVSLAESVVNRMK